jgi:hypothetical protein
MTQRNTLSQSHVAMPAGMTDALRVVLALAATVLVLVSLITVLPGAGLGYV